MKSILNLGKRLANVVYMAEDVKVTADIGCDHGYVAAELILQNKCKNIVATDISKSSLNKAILFAESINLSEYISFRSGDGAKYITKYDKVTQAIISGLGGLEMIKILKESKFKFKFLVLQPMSDIVAVRKYLLENNYFIEYDYIVEEDGRFYDIIKAKKKKANKLNEYEMYFGKDNFDLKNTDFVKFLNAEEKKYEALKEKIGELNEQYAAEYNYVKKAMSLIAEAMEKYKNLPEKKKLKVDATRVFTKENRI